MADEEDEERLPVAMKCEACSGSLQSKDTTSAKSLGTLEALLRPFV